MTLMSTMTAMRMLFSETQRRTTRLGFSKQNLGGSRGNVVEHRDETPRKYGVGSVKVATVDDFHQRQQANTPTVIAVLAHEAGGDRPYE